MDGSSQAHAVSAPLSRRRFLRNAAIAAGSVAALQVGGPGLARAAAEEASGGLPGDGVVNGVASADGRMVAVGHDQAGRVRVWSRADGAWAGSTPSGDFEGATALGIAAAGSGLVMVGYRETVEEIGTVKGENGESVPMFDRQTTPAAWTSSDGERWTAAQVPSTSAVITDIATSGSGLVAVGTRIDGESTEGVGPFVMTSADGGAWQEVSTSGLPDTVEGGLQAVAQRGGTLYALSLDIDEAAIWSSSDGARWSEHATFDGGDAPAALADGPGGLIAVGASVTAAEPRLWRVTGGGVKAQQLPSSVSDTAILRDLEPDDRGQPVLVGQQRGRALAVDAKQ